MSDSETLQNACTNVCNRSLKASRILSILSSVVNSLLLIFLIVIGVGFAKCKSKNGCKWPTINIVSFILLLILAISNIISQAYSSSIQVNSVQDKNASEANVRKAWKINGYTSLSGIILGIIIFLTMFLGKKNNSSATKIIMVVTVSLTIILNVASTGLLSQFL